ncbi:hypothetical protein NPIL_348261 [Nephila pilipes]|uniref:Uncharacterized protein n=1 Tax=Nephila pilipes TaxID=299642 RepID=A0A8X6Q972_NEPPI|nr:hypothetical protein NPIL_348261 [Nephila pilipes]
MAVRMTSTEVSECTLQFLSDLQKEGKHPFFVWVMKLGLILSTYACPKCGDVSLLSSILITIIWKLLLYKLTSETSCSRL